MKIAKPIHEIITFFRGAGWTITELEHGQWRMFFAHSNMPDRKIDQKISEIELRDMYQNIEKGYADFRQKRPGWQN